MIGWIGNFFLIGYTWGIAYKWRWALLLGVIGNTLWALRGYQENQWDLIFISVLLGVLETKAWLKWGKST